MSRVFSPASLALAVALVVVPSAAHAHIGLRGTEPAAGSTTSVAPHRIVLRFTGRPQLGFTHIVLAGQGGDVPLTPVVDSGNAISAPVPALVPGEYIVRWQTASADGHIIRGEFSFTILNAEPSAAPAQSQPPPVQHHMPPHTASPAAHVQHTEYEWARWMEFVALITVLGVLAFRHAVLPPLAARSVPTTDASNRARRLGRAMTVLYLCAAVYRLYAESVAVHGRDRALDSALVRAMVTTTTWGTAWLTGIAGAVALLLVWTLPRRTATVGTPVALLAGVALVLAATLSGHAAVQHPLALSVAADALHVLAAGAWTGGLLVMLVAGLPAMKRGSTETHSAIAALVNSFHPVALFCVALLFVSGVTSSWLRLGRIDAAWTTPYGRTLLLKLGLFAIVAGMGFYNSVRARRALGTEAGSRRIGVTAAVELSLVALVLAVTTVLVVTPFPAETP